MMIMQTAIIQCLVKWSSPGSKFRPRHRPIYQVFELIKPCNLLYCLTASWEMITVVLFSCHFIFVKLRSGPCLLQVRSSSKPKDTTPSDWHGECPHVPWHRPSAAAFFLFLWLVAGPNIRYCNIFLAATGSGGGKCGVRINLDGSYILTMAL